MNGSATSLFGVSLQDIPVLISAVGALGLAAMGVVEALGKALLVFDPLWIRRRGLPFGLPYAGYRKVRRLLIAVGPALEIAYGDKYAAIIAGQYRAGRGSSQAPDMIRQGVRLGLPYLSHDDAKRVVKAIWGMPDKHTERFVQAILKVQPPAGAPAPLEAGLAGRFSTALDTTVQAVFDSAEQVYQSWARCWAGIASVVLSLAYYGAIAQHPPASDGKGLAGWFFAGIVGLAAVPLAPVAKDLSTSLSQALTALGQTRLKIGG
jgi:hypothetical protein